MAGWPRWALSPLEMFTRVTPVLVTQTPCQGTINDSDSDSDSNSDDSDSPVFTNLQPQIDRPDRDLMDRCLSSDRHDTHDRPVELWSSYERFTHENSTWCVLGECPSFLFNHLPLIPIKVSVLFVGLSVSCFFFQNRKKIVFSIWAFACFRFFKSPNI